MTDRTHIELDLILTAGGNGLVGELTAPGRATRKIVGWLQLMDELQRALEQAELPRDHRTPEA